MSLEPLRYLRTIFFTPWAFLLCPKPVILNPLARIFLLQKLSNSVLSELTDINEPVHVQDTTCSVKENYTGKVCKITATDEDKTTPKYIITDTTNYSIDSTGVITIKTPIDYEKKTKDTVTVIVTDGEFSDTAQVIIRVLDEPEDVKITEWDHNPPPDTVKTNDPDHEFKWKICEGDSCTTHYDNPRIHKDTTIKKLWVRWNVFWKWRWWILNSYDF